MVAISFSVFKDKLLSGEKDQTIRPFSVKRYMQLLKVMGKEKGLQIYWKQRTKECEKLFDAELVELKIIEFEPDGGFGYYSEGIRGIYYFVPYSEESKEETARRDGFATFSEFYNWFYKKYKGNLEGLFMLIRFRRCGERG